MFTNGMLETDKSVIEIHGVDAQTMNMLLEFMYKGKKGRDQKNAKCDGEIKDTSDEIL